MSVILYMQQNGQLNPEFYNLVLKLWIQQSDSSVQVGYPKNK